jgi:hypothetical protein
MVVLVQILPQSPILVSPTINTKYNIDPQLCIRFSLKVLYSVEDNIMNIHKESQY